MCDVKYKDRVEIYPYCKNIFTTNSLPQSEDLSDGFFRRLHIIPFERKFEVGNSDFKREELYLQDNLDYLGNKALRAYLQMLKSENLVFANDEESQQELSKYKQICDTLYGFLTDSKSSELYGKDIETKYMFQEYQNYCFCEDLRPLGKHRFFSELENRFGFKKRKSNGKELFHREKPIK